MKTTKLLSMRLTVFLSFVLFIISGAIYSATNIPAQAWSRDVAATGYIDGAPIGGFGAGTVTWKYNGIFYKDRLNIGGVGSGGNGTDNITFTDDSARFYIYQKPSGGSATMTKLDAATLGTGQATYYSLFPKSWVDYYGSKFTVKSRVTQFSPIIPNDYQRVSYPEGIYEWELTNPTSQSVDTAIMFSWNNNFSGVSATAVSSGTFTGLVLQRSGTADATAENQGEFALGCDAQPGVTVTYLSAATTGALETDFSTDGLLSNTVGNNTIAGIAFKVTLAPGQSMKIPIVLSWDIPICQAGTGNKWYREYTKYFGRTGRNAWGIAVDALTNYQSWESQIDSWQNGVLTSTAYPEWLKTMMFNEMYVYFTGGTYWENGAASGQTANPGEDMFSHLESYIYEFYGTSDVRFYGSWALFMNWPDIDKQVLRQFSDSVVLNSSAIGRPAAIGTCAHDFGSPDTVFTQWNAYVYRDSTTWKDLNSKFVLMVYRDWHLTGETDTALLNYVWPSIKTAMAKTKSECGTSGLPVSSGIDQTYDDMDLTGDTAYCGSLFLAACEAANKIALAMGDSTQAATYQSWFTTGQASFNSELWTGSYYKIDTASTDPTRIMSDQLCGQWYAKACGLPGVVSDANAASAFQKIYDYNYSKFGGGAHGIVNVMTTAGNIDTSTPQTQECWVGTSWGAVSGMVYQGMASQANAVGNSLYNAIWNNGQFWFRTPEAWRVGLASPRALYYMRGTTVWGVKQAYDQLSSLCGANTCTPFPTSSPTYTPTPTPTFNNCATSIYRINCGGPQVTDSKGQVWAADKAYVAGNYGYVGPTTYETVYNGTISNTSDGVLYQTGHWGTGLEYKFTVPNGNYRVRMLFAEINFATQGSRVFNVLIQGNQVLSNYDIVKMAGAEYTANDQIFDITVTNGVIDITTSNITDSPKISGIEILDPSTLCPASNTPTYTYTYTPTVTGTPPTASYTPSYTNTFTPTATIPFSTIRVNCAGPQYTDTALNVWSADKAYVAGSWGYTVLGNTNNRTDTILGTTDPTLNETERWNAAFGYSFDVPPATYQVTMKFCEEWYGIAARGGTVGIGKRMFNVALEGTPVLTNFDIFAENNAADYDVDKVFIVNVTDGTLNIDFTSGTADTPLIDAIQIVRLASTPTPTFSATPTKTNTLPPTSTFTQPSTSTFTYTATLMYSNTYTQTATPVPATNTNTGTATQTYTNTFVPTFTYSATSSYTDTSVPTNTGTNTLIPTVTNTPPPGSTSTYTYTSSYTATNTIMATFTDTSTFVPSDTFTPTATDSNTAVFTRTFSETQTSTRTNTSQDTATSTNTIPPGVCLIDDCEDNDNVNKLGGYWFSYASGNGATVLPNTKTGGVFTMTAGGSMVSPGYAARITGYVGITLPDYPSAGMGTQLNPMAGPAPQGTGQVTDISNCTGIRFYAKGDGNSYLLKVPYTDASDASLTGFNDWLYIFTAPAAWSLIDAPFSLFTNQTWGTPCTLTTALSHSKNFEFQTNFYAAGMVAGTLATFNLWIDDITLYGCTSCPIPPPTSTATISVSTNTNTPTNTVFVPTVTFSSTYTPIANTPTFTQTYSATVPVPSITSTSVITDTPTGTAVIPGATMTDTVVISSTTATDTAVIPVPSVTSTDVFTSTPTYTSTALPTPTYTPTQSNLTFELTDVLTYPNPVNPAKDGKLLIKFVSTQDFDKLDFRVYTVGLRLAKEVVWDGNYKAGSTVRPVDIGVFSNLANGAFYYVLIGENAEGKKAVSKIGKIIILK